MILPKSLCDEIRMNMSAKNYKSCVTWRMFDHCLLGKKSASPFFGSTSGWIGLFCTDVLGEAQAADQVQQRENDMSSVHFTLVGCLI